MTYTKMPYAFRPAELTQAEIDNLPDEWGLFYLNGDKDLLETIRRGGDKSGLQTFADHRDREDAWVDKSYVGGNPNIFTHISHAIAADAVAILVKDAGDTAAITIASGDKVQLLTGKDADTTTVPVDITCNKNDVTFEQLKFGSGETLAIATLRVRVAALLFDIGVVTFTGVTGSQFTDNRIKSATATPVKVRSGNGMLVARNTWDAQDGAVACLDIAEAAPIQRLQVINNTFLLPAVTNAVIRSSATNALTFSSISGNIIRGADNGGINLRSGRENIIHGNTIDGNSGTDALIKITSAATVDVDTVVSSNYLFGTGRLFECASADADAAGLVLIGNTFTQGTILGSQDAVWMGNNMAGCTIDFQSKTGIVVIGGDMTGATLQNIPTDIVFRSVKGQDDRGDYIPVDGTVDLGSDPKRFAELWLSSNADIEGNLQVDGNIAVDGTVDGIDVAARDHAKYTDAEAITAVEGEATLALSGAVTVAGDLLPNADDASDLGSPTKEWKDLHLDGTARIDELLVAGSISLGLNITVGGLVDAVDIAAHIHDGTADDGLAIAATNVTYANTVDADWDGATDPGDVDDALDQLAERVKDLETVTLWFPAINHTDAAQSAPNSFSMVAMDDTQKMRITGAIPDDYVSTVSCELVIYPDATETIQADFVIGSVAPGEAADANDATNANMTKSVTDRQITEWDLLTANGGSTILPTVAAGDYMGFRIDSDTDQIRVAGIKFVYVRT